MYQKIRETKLAKNTIYSLINENNEHLKKLQLLWNLPSFMNYQMYVHDLALNIPSTICTFSIFSDIFLHWVFHPYEIHMSDNLHFVDFNCETV